MNRRQFANNLILGGAAFAMFPTRSLSFAESPQLAVTMDDFGVFDTPTMSGAVRNQAILDSLRKYKLKAMVFVTGRHIDTKEKLPLVQKWDADGHVIANHTYSHRRYENADFAEYTKDILRNEDLLKGMRGYRKYFRFPYLKEGITVEERDKMRAFLKEQGYRNGHVSIDASDWYIDGRLRQRLKDNPNADIKPYRDYYLNHLLDRAIFYDDLSRKVLGRSVKHTLLIHHNVLNGLFLGDVLEMYKQKGWKLIGADEAFNDPVYSTDPNIVPAGESLIWAIAKETGKYEKLLRYPAEDGDYEKKKMDELGL